MEFVIEYNSELVADYDDSLSLFIYFYLSNNVIEGPLDVVITKVLDSDGRNHCSSLRKFDYIFEDMVRECEEYIQDELMESPTYYDNEVGLF